MFEWSARAGGPTIDKSLKIRSVETEYADPHEPGKVHRTDVAFVAYAELGGLDVPIVKFTIVCDRIRGAGQRASTGCPHPPGSHATGNNWLSRAAQNRASMNNRLSSAVRTAGVGQQSIIA